MQQIRVANETHTATLIRRDGNVCMYEITQDTADVQSQRRFAVVRRDDNGGNACHWQFVAVHPNAQYDFARLGSGAEGVCCVSPLMSRTTAAKWYRHAVREAIDD